MDVEDVVAEQGWVLGLPVVLGQHAVDEPLAVVRVGRALGQPAAHVHHKLIRQKLQTVHRRREPAVCPGGEECGEERQEKGKGEREDGGEARNEGGKGSRGMRR